MFQLTDQGKTAEDLERLFLVAFAATLAAGGAAYWLWGYVGRQSSLLLWIVFELSTCVVDLLACLARVRHEGNANQICLHGVELAIVPDDSTEWPARNPHLLVIELVQKIASSLFTFTFFTLTLLNSTSSGSLRNLPLYLVTDVIHSLHSLVTRSITFKKYTELKSQLHRLEDPTLEQLEAADKCIICRDLLTVGCKMLGCGHIFHPECLRSWFSQQAQCPICRAEVVFQEAPQEPRTAAPVQDTEVVEVAVPVPASRSRPPKRDRHEELRKALADLEKVTNQQKALVTETRRALQQLRQDVQDN